MDYSKMTDSQLNCLAWDSFGITADMLGDVFEWRPCHPDSNQVERYLFPKLLKDVVVINTKHTEEEFTIWIGVGVDEDDESVEVSGSCKDPDQINRTKVECFLEAMEKTNET